MTQTQQSVVTAVPTFEKFRQVLADKDKNKEEIYDNSALDLFNMCPRKYLYAEGWRLAEQEQEAWYLTSGHGIHEFMYTYDLTGSFDKAIMAFAHRCKAPGTNIDIHLDTEKGSKQEFSIEWGMWLLTRYAELHPIEKERKQFRVLTDGEGKPYLEMGFAIDVGEGIFVGKIDKIIEIIYSDDVYTEGDIFIVDHKSTKRQLNDSFLKKFNPNNQMTGYCWAVHELTGRWPKGAIINGIRTHQFKRGTVESIKEKIFTRSVTMRTPNQILERADQIRWQMKVINECKKIYRETGKLFPFWQNAPNACGAFFGCGFRPLCMSQSDDLVKLLAKSNYGRRTWLPYDDLAESKRYEVIEMEPAA